MNNFREIAISEWEKVEKEQKKMINDLFFVLFKVIPDSIEQTELAEAKLVYDGLTFIYKYENYRDVFYLILSKDDTGGCYMEPVYSMAGIGRVLEMAKKNKAKKNTIITQFGNLGSQVRSKGND